MQQTINQRIVFYWESKGKRQADLSHSEYASKQTISGIWNGRTKPGCEFLERFVAENKDLNARWLFTGIGEMVEEGNPSNDAMVKFLTDRLQKAEDENKELNQEIGALKAELAMKVKYQIDMAAEGPIEYKKKK